MVHHTKTQNIHPYLAFNNISPMCTMHGTCSISTPLCARMQVSIATTFRWLGYYSLSTLIVIFQLVSGNWRRWHGILVARGQYLEIPLELKLHVHVNATSYQMDGVKNTRVQNRRFWKQFCTMVAMSFFNHYKKTCS